jgi:hypothetical protein
MKRTAWLVTLALTLGFLSAGKAEDNKAPEGFKALFNGKDLKGWKVNEGGKMDAWGADKGVLFVEGGGGGWLMTEEEFSDFDLKLEFKMPAKGNSGVALRSPMKGDPAYVGMEIQLLDDPWYLKNLEGLKRTQLTGSIYGVVPPAKEALKKVGEWNEMHITAKGRKVTIELNGQTIVEANLDDHKASEKEHPGLKREKGHLGLQSHDGRVEFRNIYVKALNGSRLNNR